MKHPGIAPKKVRTTSKRSTGFIDWAWMSKKYPLFRNHIYRIRKDQKKLVALKTKLEKV